MKADRSRRSPARVLGALLVAAGVVLLAVVVADRVRAGRGEAEDRDTPRPVAVPTPVVAPPAPTTASAARAAADPQPPTPAAADEGRDMARLRELVTADPQAAVTLAEELDRRHPGSAHAEERSWLQIDALVNLGRVGAARGHAEDHLRLYPRGPFAQRVETLTGVHPRPPR